MIKKSLIVFVVVLLLHIIIRDVLKPEIEITQVPWQANQQIGQRYLYSSENIQNIIVGSSLTYHLNLRETKEPVTNLSFTGESAHKGIDLTVARGKLQNVYPKRIYIEINTLDNYEKSIFDETIYNPFLFYPRKYVSALRDGKQPLPWLATLSEKYVTPHIIPHRYELFEDYLKYEESTSTKEVEKVDFVPNERLNIVELANNKELFMEQKLLKNLNTLIENGCEPIFIEMPVADKHRKSAKYSSIRATLERNYPVSSYIYISYPSDSNFQTYDGLHLTAIDNPRYSAYLRSVMDSISCAKKNN